MEDLKFLQPLLQQFTGTLWVVPHRVDSESVEQIEQVLKQQGLDPIRTRDSSALKEVLNTQNSLRISCVLVNEMGFLSELYSQADWAFVGGGFGAGVHSTVEPAICGIPIAIGPKGAEKFSEIRQLSQSGQLQVLQTGSDLEKWIKTLRNISPEFQKTWKKEAQSRLGATQKILAALENFKHA